MQEIEENNRMGNTRDLFKKIRDTKRKVHAKMGSIKDRNGMDLTEAENIKKRWQEYTGKTKALTRQIFVGKVMSLLLNMLSRLIITFLPRRKHLLISWLQSLSAVILDPPKIKSDTVSTVSPSICHEVMGPDAMILVF